MLLFSMIVVPFFTGCRYDGDASTLYISKDCSENITNLYIECGYGPLSYIYNEEIRNKIEGYREEYRDMSKKIIKVGDITTTPVSVTCSFERKPEAGFKVSYQVDFYYQQDKKWMHSYIFCGDSKVGCDSNKVEVNILSNGVSKLGDYFLAKRRIKASEPIPKPKFITEQD